MIRYELFLTLSLYALLVVVVFIDIRKTVIPNRIVLLMLVIQVIRYYVSRPAYDAADRSYRFLTRCVTIIFFIILLYIFFSIGALGAGDLKLLAVTAVGFESPTIFIVVAFVIAAVLSLVHAIRNQVLLSRIKYLLGYLMDLNVSGKLRGYSDQNAGSVERKEYSIHFSLPILLASMVMDIFSVIK